MSFARALTVAAILLVVVGCNSKPKLSQISGKVTFKDQPVPAGYVSFTPDMESGTEGQIRVFMVKDGVYDSATDAEPGIKPGSYKIDIAGFDGKQIPMYYQGKQIFNPVKDKHVVPEGVSTKDFVVPASAGQNIRYEQTADF
ncbi:MAG: hypothetical protein SFV81_25890 [Pirellulaceae bacterium]|nr:hypothetical protein [Pirellulaceae bacterium]